jgi:hypothetical protein
MTVSIKDRRDKTYTAQIEEFTKPDLKKLSSEWKFNWKQLLNTQGYHFMLTYNEQIQGLIKLEEENESYYVLKNVEVAPWNYGSNGQFKNVADILISYACLKSFELNTGNYKGFLVYTSKGELIEYYQVKYKAELIFRERMIITPNNGKELILKNLEIHLNHGQ